MFVNKYLPYMEKAKFLKLVTEPAQVLIDQLQSYQSFKTF